MSMPRKGSWPFHCLHGELDVGMDVAEVVKEIIQLFRSMGPDNEFHSRKETNKWACKPPCSVSSHQKLP
jgi:hypothetical protein